MATRKTKHRAPRRDLKYSVRVLDPDLGGWKMVAKFVFLGDAEQFMNSCADAPIYHGTTVGRFYQNELRMKREFPIPPVPGKQPETPAEATERAKLTEINPPTAADAIQ